MTNATKTLGIIFAGTLALALATSWQWSSSSSAAFQEALLPIDSAAVQTIRLDPPGSSTIRLTRAEDGWTVSTSDTSSTYPASADAVNRLLSTLPSLSVNAVATRQSNKHARYGVDSTGTTVTMLDANDEPLGRLVVGRTQMKQPQSQGRQSRSPLRRSRGSAVTYVRSPDKPDVYSVEQALQPLVERNITGWRDKQVWAVDRSQIQRIDFEFPADSSFTIQRASPNDTTSAVQPTATWVSEGDTLDSRSVSSAVRMLSSPRASGFVDGQSPESFGDALYSIRLQLNDGTQHTLRLRPSSSGNAYVAAADGFPYVVRLQANRWDRTVLRGRSAFLDGS